jgi:eukaryotic-like serine/threonine-protein kinase
LWALWLGERAIEAEIAEQQTRERLWLSKVDQARALRTSRRPGQRIATLRVIAEALHLPIPAGRSLAELRTEAIAALALPDLEVGRPWQGGLTPGIVAVVLDRNLKYYARLAEDGTVTVYLVSDSQEVAHWSDASPGPDRAEKDHLYISPDGRWVGVWHDGLQELTVHHWGDGKPDKSYRYPHVGNPYAVCFTRDSTRLVYVVTDARTEPDSSIAVVDLASGRPRYLKAAGMTRVSIQGSADSRRIAIAGLRAGKLWVEIRDLATDSVQLSFKHPAVSKVDLQWHPDGNTLATISADPAKSDHKIRLWDLSQGAQDKPFRVFDEHKNFGLHGSFDAAGTRLLSNDHSGALRLWEVSSGRQLLSVPAAGLEYLKVSPDDRVAIMPVADVTTLQVLRLHGTKVYRSVASGLTSPGDVVVHPAGRIAAVGNKGTVLLIDLATGREVGKLPTTDRPLRWDATDTLYTFGKSGMLRWPVQFDADNPERYRLGPPRRLWTAGPQTAWGISDDARTIAIPLRDPGADLIQLGPPPRTIRLKQKDVRSCSISPNGEWVATGSHNNSDGYAARIWNVATGLEEKKLPVPKQCRPVFSPDGRWLLTDAGGCRLWQVGTWAEGPKIGGYWGCFSPDSRLLAVEDSPGAILMVETDTGTEIARLESPEQSRLSPQCFSHDGTRLIAWGRDTGSLHIWDLQLLHQELVPLGLHWNAPSYPPVPPTPLVRPLQVEILPGDLP